MLLFPGTIAPCAIITTGLFNQRINVRTKFYSNSDSLELNGPNRSRLVPQSTAFELGGSALYKVIWNDGRMVEFGGLFVDGCAGPCMTTPTQGYEVYCKFIYGSAHAQ